MSPTKSLDTRVDLLQASIRSAELFRRNATYESIDHICELHHPEIPFRIESRARNSACLLVAPHAGTIEQGTGELARQAAKNDLSYYIFEGLSEELHITSTKFKEAVLDDLIEQSEWIVTIHGCLGNEGIFVGGADQGSVNRAISILRSFGYKANQDRLYPGVHQKNICNRASSGIQLEICKGLRDEILSNQVSMLRLSYCVRMLAKFSFEF